MMTGRLTGSHGWTDVHCDHEKTAANKASRLELQDGSSDPLTSASP